MKKKTPKRLKIPLCDQMEYPLPEFLLGRCTPHVYHKWLLNKADTLLKSDKKKKRPYALVATKAVYKKEIHEAVKRSLPYDPYTGENLEWELISQWDTSHEQPEGYRKKFALMPTIDHINPAEFRFGICSWKSNVAKSDMTPDEFIRLCETIDNYCKKKMKSGKSRPLSKQKEL
jgi:hypothetical protein